MVTRSSVLRRGVRYFVLASAAALGLAAEAQAQSVVPGHYIVVLKGGTSPEAVARDHGLLRRATYSAALNGFAAEVPAGAVRRLERDGRVAFVEADQVVSTCAKPGGGGTTTPPAQTVPWGIVHVGATSLAAIAFNNFDAPIEVDIAIIDTGIQKDHPDLNGKVVGGFNVIASKGYADPANYKDENGHGTHVAGIAAAVDNNIGVAGVATGARLWAVRVLGKTGSGTNEGVIAGVNWVAENAATIEVANMSLGGGISDALDAAVRSAIVGRPSTAPDGFRRPIDFAVAAGNEGRDADTSSPARVAEAYTVAAVNSLNALASWSNYGSRIDYAAPGVSIYSTYKGSSYATLSGTSMASPHVAGVLALKRAFGDGVVVSDVANASGYPLIHIANPLPSHP